jgi:hypothetical protein
VHPPALGDLDFPHPILLEIAPPKKMTLNLRVSNLKLRIEESLTEKDPSYTRKTLRILPLPLCCVLTEEPKLSRLPKIARTRIPHHI